MEREFGTVDNNKSEMLIAICLTGFDRIESL